MRPTMSTSNIGNSGHSGTNGGYNGGHSGTNGGHNNGHNNGAANGPMDGMFAMMQTQMMMQSANPLYAMLIITLMTTFVPIVKQIIQGIIEYITSAVRRRTERLEHLFRAKTDVVRTVVDPITLEVKVVHSVTFVRMYGAAKGGDFTTADAILDAILRQSNAQQLVVVGDLETITNMREIAITTAGAAALELVFQLNREQRDEHGELKSISFSVTSTRSTTEHIRAWARETTQLFVEARKNEIGDREYFFDQVTDLQHANSSASTVFTMTPFVTNRTLENVFFDNDDVVTSRVRFFKDNRAWYDRRGIPYTLGFLFFGVPGCGKTSEVKAIAHELRRHVINVNLGAIRTKRQLKKLFYDPLIEVVSASPSRTKVISIPIDRRLYVIEDMDCVGGENEYLMRRADRAKHAGAKAAADAESKAASAKKRESRVNGYGDADDTVAGDLDLATILNVLDGTLETPGRVILITSNHPETLDHALIRPGRIDALIQFGLASLDVVRRMFLNFYDTPVDESLLALVTPLVWTPAEVSQVFFRHFKTPMAGLRYLIDKVPSDDFRRFEVTTAPEPTTPEPVATTTAATTAPEPTAVTTTTADSPWPAFLKQPDYALKSTTSTHTGTPSAIIKGTPVRRPVMSTATPMMTGAGPQAISRGATNAGGASGAYSEISDNNSGDNNSDGGNICQTMDEAFGHGSLI